MKKKQTKKQTVKTETCEYCDTPTNAPNFAYHFCVGRKKKQTRKSIGEKLAKMDEADNLMRQIVMTNVQTVSKQEEGKTISIVDLPDCDFKSFLLAIVQDAKQAKICVVAYLNPHTNRWDAAAGYPDVRDLIINLAAARYNKDLVQHSDLEWRCENIRGHDEVLIMGEKLPKDAALILFPDWAIKEYGE